MNAIVAVTADWGIGHAGHLLVRNPADMRFFVDATMGHTVLMGRATFESLPGGRPLKGRRNVVLTRDASYGTDHPGIECVRDVVAALALVASVEAEDEVWLIGGARTYRELLPHCQRALVTYHDVTVPADAFFPNLDAGSAWRLVEQGEWGATAEGIRFCHRTYESAH